MQTTLEVPTLLLLVAGLGAIISGLLVISSTNPVHSIFSLVMAFVFSCVLLVMIGAEFLALLFMIVYVGAIAILFLFVVMMLNIRLVELLDNATRYVPIGFIIGLIFLGQLIFAQDNMVSSVRLDPNSDWVLELISGEFHTLSNIKVLGVFLYTDGYLYFIIAGLILLIAMIGAIVLTLHHARDVLRQDIFAQVIARVKDEVVLTY